MKNRILPIIFALFAASFYAINIPLSKLLMDYINPTMMAGLLYLGAGIGIGIMFLFKAKRIAKEELLNRNDFPYVLGMIVLDIVAPILLMFGIRGTTSGNASLLNNFEIVATSIIALIIFKETISKKLWIAIALVTISSGLLTFDLSSLEFTWQSLLIIAAAICWGFENNFTRKISFKSSHEIVTIKGLCCGVGSIIIGFIIGEQIPLSIYLLYALILGFVAYGLSIFFYIKAQAKLSAAKTSAFYAINPFIGVILSLIILKEMPNWNFYVALAIMLTGTIFIVIDTLERRHTHMHIHVITHTHDGTTHTHIIKHSHPHNHFIDEENHTHKHLHIHENEE